MAKPVIVQRANSYDQAQIDSAVEAVFAALPAAGRLGAGSHVLLKPNLLAKHPPEHAVTTHPAVITAVIRAVHRRGVPLSQIVLADSMGGVYNPTLMKAAYHASGMEQACRAESIECYTGCKWQLRKTNGKLVQEFSLIQPVLEADFIIDLPKLKTHVMTGYTGAVKNLFGCIPGLQKAEWHTRFSDRERFGSMLIDLLQTVQPDMAVMDAVVGMQGDGPAGGEPREVGLILGSEDLLNLDLAACRMIGMPPMRVPYLEAAHRRGLCAECFDLRDLAGDTAAFAPIQGYKLPSSYQNDQLGSTDFADYRSWLRPLVQAAEKMAAPRPVVKTAKCIGCGKCAEICPRHTIRLSGQGNHRKAKIQPRGCIRCFCCHEMCPVKAIDVRKFSLFRL